MNIAPSNEVAVVVVGYNRLHSISRLLHSLLLADYKGHNVPLVISIDASGCQELYGYVDSFEWPYGPKYLNIQQNRLGLKDHIFQCGDLTDYFRAIILLEDDIFVSPVFYSYVLRALDYYGNDERIAEISLYKNERNGYVGFPFMNEQRGYDVFLMQDVSTWGQCWTSRMWKSFKAWNSTHNERDILQAAMPELIKKWTKAWSKYYNAYVVDSQKYILYPNISLTTNFSDAGVHGNDNNSVVQVNLLQNDFDYRFAPFEKLSRYDAFFNNEDLYEWIEMSRDELEIDIYGMNNNTSKQYLLSTKDLPFKVIRKYALFMRPIELNVKNKIFGEGIYLYDTSSKMLMKGTSNYSPKVVPYFLQGFNTVLLVKYSLKKLWEIILGKLGII